jgi:hypothetical protein
MNRTTRFAAAAIAVVAACFGIARPIARADDAPKPREPAPENIELSLVALGPTPTADAVRALARKAQFSDEMTARRFAVTMATHGGYACAAALRTLIRHRTPEVRVAALRGIAKLKFRVADGMDAVREALADQESVVRDAAVAAIGAVGDASDVPTLLAAAESSDPNVSSPAFAALCDLSGARLRYRAPLWRQWWKDTQERGPMQLLQSLSTLENGRDADAGDASAVVARHAWLRLREVQNRVAACFHAETPEQRRAGYRLAADLRLGDLAEPLAAALTWEHDEENLRVGVESAKALGVAVGVTARRSAPAASAAASTAR